MAGRRSPAKPAGRRRTRRLRSKAAVRRPNAGRCCGCKAGAVAHAIDGAKHDIGLAQDAAQAPDVVVDAAVLVAEATVQVLDHGTEPTDRAGPRASGDDGSMQSSHMARTSVVVRSGHRRGGVLAACGDGGCTGSRAAPQGVERGGPGLPCCSAQQTAGKGLTRTPPRDRRGCPSPRSRSRQG